jgi:hypothetical protein
MRGFSSDTFLHIARSADNVDGNFSIKTTSLVGRRLEYCGWNR